MNSLPLWGVLGAIGVAVPVLIHFLSRKRCKQTGWAAMGLLRRALLVRSGQVKREDHLVLLLRGLALLLLALALLRPTVPSKSTRWPAEKHVGMVVAIDASLSMNHGQHSRFERAIDLARKVVLTARDGDPVSIVLMSARPEVLVRGASDFPSRLTGILDARTTATPHPLNLAHNLEVLEELVRELETPARECYLITDAQECDWAKLPATALASLERLVQRANLFVIPTGSDHEENLSLERLAFLSGILRPSHLATFTATVRNSGRHAVKEATIEFFVNNRLHRRQTVDLLRPGETCDVVLPATLDHSGVVHLRAQLAGDDLAADNARHAVVRVQPSDRVLVVAGPAGGNADDRPSASSHLTAALQPAGDHHGDHLRVHQTDPLNLPLAPLNSYDVAFLIDVPAVDAGTARRLESFVRRGGTLIIIPGDHVEAGAYNERFGSGSDGLLPATLREFANYQGKDSGWALAAGRSDHLLAGMVSRLPDMMISQPRFRKVMPVAPAPGSHTILTIPELGAPFVLSRRFGAGSVLLFTASADLASGNFPHQALFPVLLHQILLSLTNDPAALQFNVGESVRLPVRGREAGDFVTLTTPAADSVALRLTQRGNQPVAPLDFTTAGIYEIAAGPSTGAETLAVAANLDPRESDVRIADLESLTGQLEPFGVTLLNSESSIASAIAASRHGRELAPLFLGLSIMVFILQSLLALHFTRRMARPESPDLSATLHQSQLAAARRI